MRGESNAAMLKGAALLCSQRTIPGFQLVNLGLYPGMLAQGRGAVVGEVYRVPEKLWVPLDEFEEHPHVYVRTQVQLQNGQRCQTYMLRHEYAQGAPLVAHGDWRRRHEVSGDNPFPPTSSAAL